MKRGWLSLFVTFTTAVWVASLVPIPAPGQEGGAKTKGVGKAGAKPGPAKRRPDGTPDIQGNWNARANAALFDIQDHPVAREGISPGKGIIVDPPDGKLPYQPWAAAKVEDLGLHHMIEESDLHCYMAGIPHQMFSQQGMQILQPSGYVLFLWEYMHSYRTVPLDGRPHLRPDIKLFMGDSVGRWEG